jgi:hypothetical protein
MADNRDEFSEKVLAKLKEKNRAVDLTEESVDPEPGTELEVLAQSEPVFDQNFTAFDATGTAPTSGGNKDILIIPGYGGTTAASASQVNFYWVASTTSIATDNTDATGTIRRSTIFNYSDDANNPALVIGGYNGTTSLAPALTYGAVTTNTIAKIWIHPFTGTIDVDYLDLGTNNPTASTGAGILSWVGSATNRLSVGDGSTARQLAYTTDVTSANQLTASLDTSDTDLFPLFVNLVGDGTTNQIVKTAGTGTSFLLNATNGNLTIQGDVALNGGDLTSSAATFNMLTGTSTTVNAFTASTTLGIGSSAGTMQLRNATVDFTNATTISGSSGLATVFSSANPSSLAVFGAATTATIFGSATSLTMGATTGTLTLRNPTIVSSTTSLSLFDTVATTVAAFGVATTLGLGSSTGTLTLKNPTIVSSTTSLSLFDTVATTVAAFGVATTLGLGSSTGTLTLKNPTIVSSTTTLSLFDTVATTVAAFGVATTLGLGSSAGTLTLKNPTIVSSTTSLTLFDTVATTVAAFGVATTLGLGSSTGTLTLKNPTIVSSTSSLTLFDTVATTVAAFGAATTLGLGSSTGTLTLKNPTIVSSTSNLTLFNTVATTVSAFGAATTLGLGSSTGTLTLGNPTIVSSTSNLTLFNTVATTVAAFGAATTLGLGSSTGTLTLGNPTIVSSTSSLTLFNTVATTVNAFGAAATLNLGSTSGTVTIANATATFSGTTANFSANTTFNLGTSVTGASTLNIGTGAVTSATKTINIGTGADTGGTTAITIGTTAGTSSITLTADTITLGANNGTALSANSNKITNVATPTADTDAANKIYVDSARAGIDVHESVRCIGTSQLAANYVQTEAAGSTTAITATITFTSNGAQSFDGVTPTSGQSVLITGGISGSVTANSATISNGSDANKFTANGIYTVTREGTAGTTCVLTRRTDTDDNVELEGGTFTFIQEGSNYADSAWICTNDTATNPITFAPSTGTTGVITFVQFSGAGQITAGDGLTKSGNTLNVGAGTGITVNPDSVQISATYVGQTSINTLGTVTTGTWNGSTIALAYGGLGTTQFTQNGVLYGNAATSILVTAASVAAGAILHTASSGGAPTFATTLRGDYTLGTTASGSLTIDSPSIVTNTTSLTLFGTNATTLTAFGAATTLGIGSSAGTMQLRNATVDFTNATTISGSASLATVFSSANPASLSVFAAATTAVIFAAGTSVQVGATTGTLTLRNPTIVSSTSSLTLFDTVATTVNAFGAATTIAIGSTTGTITIDNPTIATATSSLTLFNTVATTVAAFGASTTLGLGSSTGILTLKNPTIVSSTSSLTLFDTVATTVAAFGAATVLGLGSSTGTLTLKNPTIVSSTSSLTLFNTVATTVAAFGAATTLGLGSSTGTLTLGNPTIVSSTSSLTLFNTVATTVAAFGAATTLGLGSSTGTLTLGNPTIVSSTSSLTLFNTVATTVNAFGAATTLNLGSTSGTVTIANATAAFSGTTANFSANTAFNLGTSVTGASTLNIGTGAVTSATKTINIGTGAASGGTTAITIGTTTGTSTTTINGSLVLSSALPIAQGGTGTGTAPTQWGVIFATSTTSYASTGAGSTDAPLLARTGAAPAFAALPLGSSNAVSGTLGVSNGGTGLSSYTVDGVLYATASTTVASSANLKYNASTTTGSVTTSAFYVNTAVTTGTAMHLAAASMTSGNAFVINAGNGSFTSGKIIDAQNNGSSKFSIDFNGNLRATTKSFDIEHPTKPGKRLVYGVLEGPEHGVYHRGTVEGKGLIKVELPEYWHALVGENYSVQITPWGNYSVHIVEKTENYFIIQLSGNIILQKFKNIKVDYIIHGSRTDAPLEIEQD